MLAGDSLSGERVDLACHLQDMKVAGFGPGDSGIGHFDHQPGVAGSVGDIRELGRRFAGPRGTGADHDYVVRCVGFFFGLVAGAFEDGRHLLDELDVVWPVPRFVESVLTVEQLLFEKGKKEDSPAMDWSTVVIRNVRGWKRAVGVVVDVESETDLLEVVAASRSPRALRPMDRGKEQGSQKANHNKIGSQILDRPDASSRMETTSDQEGRDHQQNCEEAANPMGHGEVGDDKQRQDEEYLQAELVGSLGRRVCTAGRLTGHG